MCAVPERIRTEVFEVIGHPFLSHIIDGKGIPEASQTREMGFFSTVLMFSGNWRSPAILGGTIEKEERKVTLQNKWKLIFNYTNFNFKLSKYFVNQVKISLASEELQNCPEKNWKKILKLISIFFCATMWKKN